MKKALILTVALVLALAGSAAAAVTFGGSFDVTLEHDAFEFGAGEFAFDSGFELLVEGEAGEEGYWSFEVELIDLWDGAAGQIGEYGLEVTDELFTLNIWGNDYRVGWMSDPQGFVRGHRDAPDPGDKLRLSVPVADLFRTRLDYDPGRDIMHLIVDQIAVDEYSFGAAFQRGFDPLGGDDHNDTLLAFGVFDLDMAKVTATAGITFSEDDDNLLFGVKAESDLTDEMSLTAEFRYADANVGANRLSDAQELNLGLGYDLGEFDLSAWFEMDGPAGDFDTTTIGASVEHNFLMDDIDLDLELGFETSEGDNELWFEMDGTIVADLFWIEDFEFVYEMPDGADDFFTVDAEFKFQATEKLALFPYFGYNSDTEVLEIGNVAEYAVGSLTLALDVMQETTAGATTEELISFSTSVSF